MAQRKDSISLRIRTIVEELQDLDNLLQKIDQVGEGSAEASEEVQSLNREFAGLQKQQEAINQFQRLSQTMDKTSSDLKEARTRATELGRAMATADKPTKTLERSFERASSRVRKLKEIQSAQVTTLQAYINKMKAAGVDTSRLTAEQVRLASAMNNIKGKISDTSANLKKMRGAYDDAGDGADRFSRRGSRSLDATSTGVAKFTSQLRDARNLLLGFFGVNLGAGLVKDLTQISDQWSNLNSRIGLATDSQEEYVKAQTEAFRIAQDSKTAIEDVVNLETRLHTALKTKNTSLEESIALTELITKAMKVSGATNTETSATIQQFIQGMQSGVLRGQEFNSMMEQGPRLAKALADGLDVPVDALRSMAEQGELTAVKVRDALLGQVQVVREEFNQLPSSVDGAITRLENSWARFIGRQNESVGATQEVSKAISLVADNLEEVATAALLAGEVIAAAYAVKGVNAARAYIAEMVAARAATIELGNSVDAAGKKLSKLTVIANTLGAAFVGWQIGTYLREQFETVEKAGIAMAAGLTRSAEKVRYSWELASAVFTDDTLAEAIERHNERLRKIDDTYGDMFASVGKTNDAIRKTGDAASQGSSGLTEFEQKTKEITEETRRLADQLALVSDLQAKGVITDSSAIDQKQKLIDQLKELSGGLKSVEQSEKDLKASNTQTLAVYSKKINAAKTEKEVTDLLAEATRTLGKDTDSVGRIALTAATQIEKLNTKISATGKGAKSYGQQINDLGQQYRDGTINAEQFLNKVNELGMATEGQAKATNDAAQAQEGMAISVGDSLAIYQRMVSHISSLKDELSEYGERAVQVFQDTLQAAYEHNGAYDRVGVVINAATSEADRLASELDETNQRIEELAFRTKYAANEVSKWFAGTALVAEKVKAVFLEQQLAAERLGDRLSNINGASAQTIDQLERAVDGFNLLDESDLSNLRSEISRLRAEQEALNGSIETTLRNLQDEFDRLSGNESSIQMRDFQQRLAELQQQQQQAIEANNQVGVQNAAEAIRILRQVHSEKMRQIRDENIARSEQVTGQQQGTLQSRETVDVRFNLPSGGTATGTFDANEGDNLLEDLKQLQSTGL